MKKLFLKLLNSEFGQFIFNGAIIRLPEEMHIAEHSKILSVGQHQKKLLKILGNRLHLKTDQHTVAIEDNEYLINTTKKTYKNLSELIDLIKKNKFDLVLCGHYTNLLNNEELRVFISTIYQSINTEGIVIIWNFEQTNKNFFRWFLNFPFSLNNFTKNPNKRILEAAKETNVEFMTEVSVRPFLFPFIKRESVILGKPPK
ncbi:MAG: hypothetical protein CL779_00450 [Chloroflexi bacterium]|nr:hypothetical protein [Chloroflexota bacterium]